MHPLYVHCVAGSFWLVAQLNQSCSEACSSRSVGRQSAMCMPGNEAAMQMLNSDPFRFLNATLASAENIGAVAGGATPFSGCRDIRGSSATYEPSLTSSGACWYTPGGTAACHARPGGEDLRLCSCSQPGN